jgi:hypothetical protein
LIKIQSIIGFDIVERYEKLVDVIEDLENPYFDSTLKWYKLRLERLQIRAIEANTLKTYKAIYEEKPKPKKAITKTVVKKRIPGKPAIMKEEVKKEKNDTRGMTSIQKLIWEKRNKAKKEK